MSFGTRMRERRESAGLTQKELGAILGVSGNAIGNYESGVSSPNADSLYKLFDVLKCDANYLFQDDVKKQSTDDDGLSEEADRIITLFRKVPENQQNLAADLVEAVLIALIKNVPVQTETQSSVLLGSGH